MARHWAAGERGLATQNGVDIYAISNLAIGFPLFGTRSLVKGKG